MFNHSNNFFQLQLKKCHDDIAVLRKEAEDDKAESISQFEKQQHEINLLHSETNIMKVKLLLNS